MARLILVKHAQPEQNPTRPANEWLLSDSGRASSLLLAERLCDLCSGPPDAIITSAEPKAAQTGQVAARALGIASDVAPGLHEHDRRNVTYASSKAEFEAHVAELFAKPDQLVFGGETAHTARARFSSAVQTVLAERPAETVSNVVIVAHGTVITLFAAHHDPIAVPVPFALWQRLGLPSIVVFSRPTLALQTVIEQV
jgi:broad specificity phosphatase PhoE